MSDEESEQTAYDDDLQLSLVQSLMPVLPVAPDAMKRISRWWYAGCPKIILQLLVMLMMKYTIQYSSLDCVEYFAGRAMIAGAFEATGMRSAKFEYKDDNVRTSFLGQLNFNWGVGFAYSSGLTRHLWRRRIHVSADLSVQIGSGLTEQLRAGLLVLDLRI